MDEIKKEAISDGDTRAQNTASPDRTDSTSRHVVRPHDTRARDRTATTSPAAGLAS
jgi:hypothetical protein